MQAEAKEMTEARGLLARFETQMDKPDGVALLSEALSLLGDVRDNGESEKTAEIASNIALAYARKVQRQIESLAREAIVHLEVVEHWLNVLQEFDHAGFTLPPEMAAARSTLLLKKMSPSERQYLLEKRQAVDGSKASDQ